MNTRLQPLVDFLQTLPRNGDIEIDLLKGHLLIEQALRSELARHSKKPELLDDVKLSFSLLIGLVRSFSDMKPDSWVWGALRKLNQARNELAHNLSKRELEKKMDAFVVMADKAEPSVGEDAVDDRFTEFHWALLKLYMSIALHTNMRQEGIGKSTLLRALPETGSESGRNGD